MITEGQATTATQAPTNTGNIWFAFEISSDLIIAAAAEAAGLVLLHYDSDFEIIAQVTRQPAEWVVKRGSV